MKAMPLYACKRRGRTCFIAALAMKTMEDHTIE